MINQIGRATRIADRRPWGNECTLLEVRVSTPADAIRVLVHGLEDLPMTEPGEGPAPRPPGERMTYCSWPEPRPPGAQPVQTAEIDNDLPRGRSCALTTLCPALRPPQVAPGSVLNTKG